MSFAGKTVVVTGGSVTVTAYITVPVHTPSDTVQEALKSTVGTQAAASTVLGVTVETAPVVVSNEPPRAPPSPPAALTGSCSAASTAAAGAGGMRVVVSSKAFSSAVAAAAPP